MTVTATLDLARRELGTVESPPSSNNVRYAQWFGMNREPWCAMFVSWILAHSGNTSGYRHASVAFSLDWARKNGRRTGEWRAGYVACRINNGTDWGPGHTGIVEAVHSDGSVTCIEGNTSPGAAGSQRDGGGVWRRRRPKGYWNKGCIRIDYPTSSSPPPPTPEPDRVRPTFDPPHVLRPIVDAQPAPEGGTVLLGVDGSIYAYGGSTWFQGMNGSTHFAGRRAATLRFVGDPTNPTGAERWEVTASTGERYRLPTS